MAPTMEHLIERVTALAMHAAPLTRQNAEDFLGEFSLDFLFTAFQSGSLDEGDVQTAASALSKVLKAADPLTLMPKLLQYSIAALAAGHEAVRQLGMEQLTRLSQLEHVDAGVALGALFKAMQNSDTGIGVTAVKALVECFTGEGSLAAMEQHREVMSALLKHSDAVVQMRGLELLLKVAGDSPESRAMVERTGLLDVGMGPLLAFDDPLGCLACWDLFAELLSGASANANNGIIAVVSGWLQPRIGHVVRSIPGLDRTLQIGIMKLICSIVGQTTTSSGDSTVNVFRQVTSALMQQLTEKANDHEWFEIGLDCFGQLGRRAIGSEMLVMEWPDVLSSLAESAFGSLVQPSVRMTALHSLAMIADSSGSLLLTQQVEDILKKAVCSTCENEESPASTAWRLMKSGPLELRDAVYQLMTALMKRPWFLIAVCRNTELINHISSPKSEIHAELSKSRYACLQALVAALRSISQVDDSESVGEGQLSSLRTLLSELERALESGPFGRGVGVTSSVPVVGTESR